MSNRVVALVPAKDRADSVADTVRALAALADVDEVLVIDDGSSDRTSEAAAAAGARVLRLPANRGKGAAVTAGVLATPDATVYLMVDADTATTAAAVAALLPPVLAGEVDMSIAVPPDAGGRGGFGWVKSISSWGIERAVGFGASAPLSGQRAIDATLLRKVLPLAERFGLETALTIDLARAGGRVREIPVAIEHRHTGRSLAGFRHRAGQGVDIVRALWPRLTSSPIRLGAMILAFGLIVTAMVWSGGRWEAPSAALLAPADKVIVFGVPHLDIGDVGGDLTPNLNRLMARGSVGVLSVRTYRSHPSSAEAYATLGAGIRLHAPDGAGVAEATDGGAIVVPGGQAVRDANRPQHHGRALGGMGQALVRSGHRTAVVSNADHPSAGRSSVSRPAALAVVDGHLRVGAGSVDPSLLRPAPQAPFGVEADPASVAAAAQQAISLADVVMVDPGDLDRAAAARAIGEQRSAAIRHTDHILGLVADAADPTTLLIVASLTPAAPGAHVTPIVVVGPSIPHGYVHSPSTKRTAVATVTDLAPTILGAIGRPTPKGMVGQPLRYQKARPDLGMLRTIDRDAALRERIGNPVTIPFVVFQVAIYLLIAGLFAFAGGVGRLRGLLRLVVLAIAALPLAGLAYRAVPGMSAIGPRSVVVLFVLDGVIVALATRWRGRALSPLVAIMVTTVAVLVADVSSGVHLLTSSFIGYPLSGSGRFYGLGNAGFSVLSVCTLLAACAHVHHAPRRREALVAVGLAFLLVLLADTAPTMGDDVGGVLTLVPVFGLTFWILVGRRLSWRPIAAAAATTVGLLAVLVTIDSTRAPSQQTHLGRFFTDVRSGGVAAFWSTVARRTTSNLGKLGTSVWTVIVPVLVLGLVYLLLRNRRWRETVPAGPLRIGVVAAFLCGLLGFAANDSGVIVTALVFVFVGPFVALLAFEQEAGGPQMIEPGSDRGRPAPLTAARP